MSIYDGFRRMGPAQKKAAALLAAIFIVAGTGATAHAATFTVNVLFDMGDAVPGDGVAEIVPGTGVTTLRAAMEEANALPGPDTIVFDSAITQLDIETLLPFLSDALGGTTIDGGGVVLINGLTVTDPDPVAFVFVSPGNRLIALTISGFTNGIEVRSANNTINTVTVIDNVERGILLTGPGASGNSVFGCTIGFGGTSAQTGIEIAAGAQNNLIGGLNVAARNIISGNGMHGIRLTGAGTSGNVIQGNYIGLDDTGAPAPNREDGIIFLGGANNNVVGPTNDDILADAIEEGANVISGNTLNGILMQDGGTTGNMVRGNIIGTAPDGGTAAPNGEDGVRVTDGASQNIIGHTAASNIIAANTMYGVHLSGVDTAENQILGNFIGTNGRNTANIGNELGGVLIINGAMFNRIGGIQSGAGNVISGNSFYGLDIEGFGTNFNAVLGNQIGTDAEGLTALPNSTGGVRVWAGAKFNQIGAEPFGSRNVISGNLLRGVDIRGVGTDDNAVENNYIGPDITGLAPIGNSGLGISISSGAQNNRIGGVQRRQRNIISGNVTSGIIINGSGTSSNTVLNNYVGTDATGQAPMPNGDSGIIIDFGATGNEIGGTADGSRNVVSGNVEDGIQISGIGSNQNTVLGNYIGVNNLGEVALGMGNTNNGISVVNGAASATIGGTAGGAANLIAGNGVSGIEARGAGVTGIRMLQNAIHSNGGQGILLSNGANGGVVPPVLTALVPISGTAAAGAVVEIFVDTAEEGEIFLESVTASGAGVFTGTANLLDFVGMNVTATETGTGTSEFSVPIPLTPAAITQDPLDVIALVDDTVNFSAAATGAIPLNYQWQYWDGTDPGDPSFTSIADGPGVSGATTETLTLLAVAESDEGFYRCMVSNLLGQIASQGAFLTVFPNFVLDTVITTANDLADGNTNSLAWLAAVPGADGAVSLREAILAANNTPAPVTLSFDPALLVDPDGLNPILLISPLPPIDGAGLSLDGTGVALFGLPLGGSANGLELLSANNHISGFLILGFPGSGILIRGGNAIDNTITGCILFGNGGDGITIDGAADNLIGGTAEGEENILFSNSGAGIRIAGSGADGNLLQGNVIGVDTPGVFLLFGNGTGVVIEGGAAGNTIGGVAAGAGNVIVDNLGAGVHFDGTGTAGNIAAGNLIGLAADGTVAGNGLGVLISGGASDNLIGGTDAGAANVIANSLGTGVLIEDTATVRNQLRRNSIYNNGGAGINVRNLANGGIQPPVITGFGSVAGTAGPGDTVELFLDSENEGETYLDTVTADAQGNFSSTADVTAFAGKWITATATDAAGNSSEFSEAFPIDRIPPEILLIGGDQVLECGSGVYQELGAAASDNVDGDITAGIVIRLWLGAAEVATLDASAAGVTYTVTYDVNDAAGNAATTVERSVAIVDTTAPQLTLNGGGIVNMLLGNEYIDAGATATDLCEGGLTSAINVNNPVDTNTEGAYTVTYTVSDSAENEATGTRTVNVLASIGVTLILNGPSAVTAECGLPYVDAGATALDGQGNDISGSITVSGTVDTSAVGTVSTLVFNATDANGNPAPAVTRTVEIVDNAGPVITLVGNNTIEVDCFSFYLDDGAVAVDDCEGDVSNTLSMTSNVDTRVPGAYEVRYTAVDGRGNQSSVIRNVVVLACNSECELACENDPDPVDNDGDGLTACVEVQCLGTSDDNPDSDGDGMPDGFEAGNGLDPLIPDGDGDLDRDGITNLDEFLDGSLPGDPNSPGRTVYVAEDGTDSPLNGSLGQPYASITFALAEIFNPQINPTRIVVFSGVYPGALTLRPNAGIIGALGAAVRIEGAVRGAENTQLMNLEIFGVTGDTALLDMTDVTMTVRGVLFQGSAARPGAGILAAGEAPGASVIEGCAFASLNAGIEILGEVPLIRDCHFSEISIGGVVFQQGANVAGRANGKFRDANTGWNVFDIGSFDGSAILNFNNDTAVMEINDWSSNDAGEIGARMQGPVDFTPFLGAGSGGLAATVYVVTWDTETQERIENARITLLGAGIDTVRENDRGVYVFSLVPGTEYVVEVEADGYGAETLRFEVDAGQRRSLIIPLIPGKDGIIGCHASGAPHSHDSSPAGGLVPIALVTLVLLAARARMRRKHHQR